VSFHREFTVIEPINEPDGFAIDTPRTWKSIAAAQKQAINRIFRAPDAVFMSDSDDIQEIGIDELWQLPEQRYRC